MSILGKAEIDLHFVCSRQSKSHEKSGAKVEKQFIKAGKY